MENQRTISQNKSLHKLFTDIASHCVAYGIDTKPVLTKLEQYPTPVSPQFVKESWRAMQIAVTGKTSTADLDKKEIDQVYDVFNKFWSELTGEHFPFPSYDQLALQHLLDNEQYERS